MRRRGIRVFAIILVIVALSIATLSFKEIHIGGFDREASGPLGLTLGLDLQGGSHLVYRANLPDQARVTFQEPLEGRQLLDLLEELDQDKATLSTRDFIIQDLFLEEKVEEDLRIALGALSPIETFEIGDDALNVTFQNVVDEGVLGILLQGLDFPQATIHSGGENQYAIQGLFLAGRGEALLELDLGELAPIRSFTSSDGVVEVSFNDFLQESELRLALGRTGQANAVIETPAQTQFAIGGLALDDLTTRDEFTNRLENLAPVEPGSLVLEVEEPTPDQMDGVVDTIQRRINALGTTEPIVQTLGSDRVIVQLPGVGGSSIGISFTGILGGEFIRVVEEAGITGFTVQQLEVVNGFVVGLSDPLSAEATDRLRDSLTLGIAPPEAYEVRDEREITVVFPPPPDAAVLESLLTDLGITEYTIQSISDGGFVIRTENTLTTPDQEELRRSLDALTVGIVAFDARGGIEEAKQLIGGTAQLEFKERQCLDSEAELTAAFAAGLPDPCRPLELGGGGRLVDRDIELSGNDLARAYPASNPTTNEPEIHLEFNGRGRGIFSELTRRLAGDQTKRMPIFLDGEQLIAPVVQAHITDGNTRITGRFTREDTIRYGIQLESGRLPVPLEPITEISVDALLGADSLRKSLIAGMVGLVLVLLFMVVYYRMAGVVAATALVLYAVVLMSIFKLVPITITLSGVAGLVLSIGMAVDANILIFERMKEEMRTGRTLSSAMEAGFRRAWPAIRDSNFSTIITCLILWWFGSRTGTPVVTGFALTLLIGVIVSMFTALMVSRNMLQILALTPIAGKMNLFTPEPRRQPLGIAGASPGPGRREAE